MNREKNIVREMMNISRNAKDKWRYNRKPHRRGQLPDKTAQEGKSLQPYM